MTDALLGDLTPEARRRFHLDPPPGAGTAAPQDSGTLRNAGIKAEKAKGAPPRVPGAPSSPWQLSRASWIETFKRVVKEFSKDRVTSVAAGVTFFGLLALFPAITALVSIYGLFADNQTILDQIGALNRILPQSAVELIRGQIVAIVDAPARALGIATVVGLLAALWSAMGGMKALIQALNIAWFQTERRGFIKLNLLALGMTLGGIVLVIAFIAAIAVLPAILNALPGSSFWGTVANWARWPLIVIALTVALAALYRFAPDKDDAKWHWISPGALIATAGLLIASVLFSWYASNFANYNETYGSLGAAIALMMWLWIACTVVLVGAEVNSEVERQIQKENGIPLEDDAAKDTSE
ncbi:YihY/virulence factor BrkB family protein [Paracoccus sp. S-4012]|uniref:YihY/virulence factor BrkB family protein n=1 Tax=Paracoccus sp. S-4012 TaxID=2665648 RepID=UPI0018A23A61